MSADLAHWYTLPDALPSQPGWGTCDGTVSFPDLGEAPFDGSTPVITYGPNCGGALPPLPPPPAALGSRAGAGSGDYPRFAVSRPQRVDDPYDSLYNLSFAHLFLLAAFRSKLSEYSCNLRLSRSLNHFR